MPNALVTGAAGFIGSHLTEELLSRGWSVTGLDCFDDFYTPAIKKENIASVQNHPRFELVVGDVRDLRQMQRRLSGHFDAVVHLAAKAGVGPSLKDPIGYQMTNVGGTQNLLELARGWKCAHFLFASSSSVYGINPNVPWSEEESVVRPISPYACTKVSAEILGHVYNHLFGLPFTSLRFFTVYGPRQRPDLAIHKFASLIRAGNPVTIYGNGHSRRDYTYISDIVSGIMSALNHNESGFEIFNLGSNEPVTILELVRQIGLSLDVKPNIQFLSDQPGDLPQTWANLEKSGRLLNYAPQVQLDKGLRHFAQWFRDKTRELRKTR